MLFIFPTSLEAEPFRRLCPEAEVVISGVGMAATAATLVSLSASGKLSDDRCVVLAGIAGHYADSVARGEVVEVVSETTVELPERFRQRYDNEPMTALRGVKSNSVHRSVADSKGADIENMEGATLFAVCGELGVRCAEIRAISNRVGEEFAKWSIDEALNNLASVLKSLYADK
jgi:nucleoside phosphorylase